MIAGEKAWQERSNRSEASGDAAAIQHAREWGGAAGHLRSLADYLVDGIPTTVSYAREGAW
jgi:hypothetical protein